jgi:hypothetical protein
MNWRFSFIHLLAALFAISLLAALFVQASLVFWGLLGLQISLLWRQTAQDQGPACLGQAR